MDSFRRSLVPESSACSFEIGQPDVAVRFGHAENDLVAGDREANTGNLLGGHERTPRLMEVIHGERRSQGALAGGVQALRPKAAETIALREKIEQIAVGRDKFAVRQSDSLLAMAFGHAVRTRFFVSAPLRREAP
jgi:hypothetical protein